MRKKQKKKKNGKMIWAYLGDKGCDYVENIIEINNLSCKSGKRYLIKDITWNVKKGEQWVVYGLNGSGKTTLLSIIAGYKHFTSGTMKVFGECYSNKTVLDNRKKIGFVSSSFYDKYYSRENVLDVVLSGKTGALGINETIKLEDVILAKKILKNLHVGDKINRQYDMLSKGERQNVLIARALINQPELLIFDEPSSGLDIYNREYLYKLLEMLTGRLSVIYVTHHPDEILPIFDKCLLLKKGTVFKQGDMKDVFTSETLSALLDYDVKIGDDHKGRKTMDLIIPEIDWLEIL